MRHSFKEIYKFTKQWEGGKVVDPGDPGGATAYGVSFRFLKGMPLNAADFDGDGRLTWLDIMAMEEADAESIFHWYFWNETNIHRIPLGIRAVMFDTAVNVGRKRAAKWLQFMVGAKTDGIIGDETLSSTWECQDRLVACGLLARRRAHYCSLAARRVWARKYYNGWINRTTALETLTLGTPWSGCRKQ